LLLNLNIDFWLDIIISVIPLWRANRHRGF
jgi:hypothetical protein